MVTKGIVTKVNWIGNKAFSADVNIPFLNTIQESFICTLPNCNFIPQENDVVFVTFEDYDINKPVIIGCLFKESGNTSSIDLDVQNLIVKSICKLSEMTSIGDINYEQIKYLKGLEQNIQSSFKNIEDRLDKLEGNS